LRKKQILTLDNILVNLDISD